MLKKFVVETTPGTKCAGTTRSFFGSALMDIEDEILVGDGTIQYAHIVDPVEFSDTDGFQYPQYVPDETIVLLDLSDLKSQYSSISMATQNQTDLYNNTRWILDVDVKSILTEYLFARVKESRAFMCIRPEDTLRRSVNTFVREYIDTNLVGRFGLKEVTLYVRYKNIVGGSVSSTTLRYNPLFDRTVLTTGDRVSNVNVVDRRDGPSVDSVRILYSQTKKSTVYTFDYYFNLSFYRV